MDGRNFTSSRSGRGSSWSAEQADDRPSSSRRRRRGKPATARMTVGKSQEFRFIKAAPLKALGAAELAAYAGTYVSEELLDAKYRISVDKDSARAQDAGHAAGRAQGHGPGQVHGPRLRAEHRVRAGEGRPRDAASRSASGGRRGSDSPKDERGDWEAWLVPGSPVFGGGGLSTTRIKAVSGRRGKLRPRPGSARAQGLDRRPY